MKRCNRFRRDGTDCTNQTDYADGWCRHPDCPGFPRPDLSLAPMPAGGAFRGTARHISETGHLPTGDITVEDVADVRVSNRALDTFRFRHGGSEREAEVQLRSMLEDFLLKSARRVSKTGYRRLSREGYELTVAPADHVITHYSTIHRERTWEQVKAGVKSRIKSGIPREASGPQPERGPAVDLSGFAAAFDPSTAHLTARARRSYARIAELKFASDEELDAAIRAALTELAFEKVVQRDDACFDVDVADRIWIISPDCRSIIGVKEAPTSRTPSDTAAPVDDLGTSTRFGSPAELVAKLPADELDSLRSDVEEGRREHALKSLDERGSARELVRDEYAGRYPFELIQNANDAAGSDGARGRMRLLWGSIAPHWDHYATAMWAQWRCQNSAHGGNTPTRRFPSLIAHTLKTARWVPAIRGKHPPLDEGGDEDENQDEDDSDNEPIDVAEAIFDAFNRQGEAEVEEFVGDGAAANPARRQERSAEALSRSKEAEPSRGARFKFLSQKVWERRDPAVRAYLLQTYGGRCQICQATFPRRDGQPFFEARYIVSRVARRWLDTPGNSLCLCPTCLAKTLHGSSKAIDVVHELRELAGDAANLPDGGTVSFELCGEPVSMRFAQRHLIDLGALLAVESVEPQ
jgi:hypothetical protein